MGPLQRLCAGLVVTASTVLAGCILFTGGTGGYVAADAGAGSGGKCKASSDCQAGQFCCYELDGGIPTSTTDLSSLLNCGTCEAWQRTCAVASDCEPRGGGGSGEAGQGTGEEGDSGEAGTGGGDGGGGGAGGGSGGGTAGTPYECITQACAVEGLPPVNVSTCGPIPFCSQ